MNKLFGILILLLFLVFLFLVLMVPVETRGEDLSVSFGDFSVNLPLMETSAGYLYDFRDGRAMLGMETPIIEYKSFTGNVGAVTNLEGQGSPYMGIDFKAGEKFSKHDIRVGLWGGYDFNHHKSRGGLKASMPIWGEN